MNAAADSIPSSAQPSGAARAERRFYGAYTLAILLAILVGFAPSLLLPLQAWMIAAGRRGLHMQLGKAGFPFVRLLPGFGTP
jgi:hypothetical protein